MGHGGGGGGGGGGDIESHICTTRTRSHTYHIHTPYAGVIVMAILAEVPKIQPLNLFSKETVETLTNGFLAMLEPDLEHIQRNLDDLMLGFLSSGQWLPHLVSFLPSPPPLSSSLSLSLSATQDEMLQSVNEKKAYLLDQKVTTDIAAAVCLCMGGLGVVTVG